MGSLNSICTGNDVFIIEHVQKKVIYIRFYRAHILKLLYSLQTVEC